MKLSSLEDSFLKLTMLLELRVKEYQKLCQCFETFEKEGVEEDSEQFKLLLKKFIKNQQQISSLKQKLSKLSSTIKT